MEVLSLTDWIYLEEETSRGWYRFLLDLSYDPMDLTFEDYDNVVAAVIDDSERYFNKDTGTFFTYHKYICAYKTGALDVQSDGQLDEFFLSDESEEVCMLLVDLKLSEMGFTVAPGMKENF